MLKLIETIAERLFMPQAKGLELRELKVQFIRNRTAILNHLKLCKKSHGIIGIYATRLGKGMFLGTVTSIYHDVITLKPIEQDEMMTKTIMLPINEITSICPFNQLYVEAEYEAQSAHDYLETATLAHAVS